MSVLRNGWIQERLVHDEDPKYSWCAGMIAFRPVDGSEPSFSHSQGIVIEV